MPMPARRRPHAPLARGLACASALLFGLASCGDDTGETVTPPAPISFALPGSLSAASGKGSFRFGAASAATQIEDQNEDTDWWIYTAPEAQGGLAKGEFVGDASKGYSKALEDIALMKELGLDSYRFSIEWARIEPERDVIDEEALAHYDEFIDALIAEGIEPVITVHHFSNPVWVDDPRDLDCVSGPTDANLCGFDHPTGSLEIIEEFGEHAALLAERFGDRVDTWGTMNEPVNYLLAAYGAGSFPPGKRYLLSEENLLGKFVPVVRTYLRMHAAAYRALDELDTVDADGDGDAASIGLTLSVGVWKPARNNAPSEDPADVEGAKRVEYVYHHLFVDSVRQGKFDPDLDGTLDEDLPEIGGTIEWLGVQYYFRTGVTAQNGLIPVLGVTPCFSFFDFGSCLPPADATHCVPSMKYEYYEAGIYEVLRDFSGRWPDLPMVVSESGIATELGTRRAEHVVRSLEQIQRAIDEGSDVRGYYHWSLYDNFEWAEGYHPRFGLYTVDYTTYARSPTEGATVLAEIAKARELSSEQRETYGGTGPMTPEPGYEAGPTCAY